MKKTNPIQYVVAKSPDEVEMINGLWQGIYVEEKKWLSPGLKDLVHDRYHPHSIYLLATSGHEAVGSLRIVCDSEIGLPIEQFFHLGLLKENQKFAESQRLMVSPSFRGAAFEGAPFGVCEALIKACIHYCFRNKISHVFANAFADNPNTPIDKFKLIGFNEIGCPFQDTELSDPRRSVALLLTFPQLLTKAYTFQGDFFRYLLEFDQAFLFYNDSGEKTSDSRAVK